MTVSFEELGISEGMTEILKKQGITSPTPIQEAAIETIKNGEDVIAQAQTGSGKTLAFLLPIFENIDINNNNVQALIIAPTRELALQISEVALKLQPYKAVNVLSVYGGKDIGSQINKLSNNVHLVVATPGRLLDHLDRGTIHLKNIKTLVLDEADQMLLMGFKNEVESIIAKTSKKHQTICLSATMNKDVKKLAYRYTKEPQVIIIEEKEVTLDTIEQEVVETTDRRKQTALLKVLNEDNPFLSIIFCRTKRRVNVLEEAMVSKGFNCQKLHGDVPQSKRERVMKAFKSLDIQFLVATDVASRGLDISGVTHVYNYDVPESSEEYIHRIGRTGRAGQRGKTCMFVAEKDMELLEMIENETKQNIPRREININKDEIDNIKAENYLPKKKYNKRINTNPKKFKK